MASGKRFLAAAAIGTTLFAVPLAGIAQAHERRTVGTVQMVVGWLNEPAYTGFLNAVQLRLADDAGPITDVGDALKVEVSFGSQKVGPLPLAAAFGVPGEYRSPMVPNRPGAFTFRFIGSVRGAPMDQSFTSSDKTFNSPQDTADVLFPAKDPSIAQLGTRIERLEPRVDSVRDTARSATDDATSAATRATVIGVLGLVAGLAGLAFGVAGRRSKAMPAAESTVSSQNKTPSKL